MFKAEDISLTISFLKDKNLKGGVGVRKKNYEMILESQI